jgi:hypothetical protein
MYVYAAIDFKDLNYYIVRLASLKSVAGAGRLEAQEEIDSTVLRKNFFFSET